MGPGSHLNPHDHCPPYTFNWTGVAAASYSLTAKATDSQNGTTTSAPVNVTVNAGVAQLYFIAADHLNTPRAIANQANQVVWRWHPFEPFGANPPDQNPNGLGTFEFNLRLPGQYFDQETNTHYNYYRDYDPGIGRYIQSDPIGLAGGINPYIYVYDDPIRFADPTGEFGLAGAGYGLIAGGISGYISSGGKWQGAVTGGLAGAAIGAINPFSSTLVGAAAGGVLASAVGQVGGNLAACRDDIWSIDWDLAIISGVGGGAGRGFATYLVQPRRSAFTYAANQRMGPGNPVALQSFQATIRGGSSGTAQLGYKSAFYPTGYPANQCVPQDPCGYPR